MSYGLNFWQGQLSNLFHCEFRTLLIFTAKETANSDLQSWVSAEKLGFDILARISRQVSSPGGADGR
jgi:hypothetical protein